MGAGELVRLRVTGPGGSGLAPIGSGAAVLNVTATEPTRATYVSVYPSDYARDSETSNINVAAGRTTPNLVVTKVAADGTVTLYNSEGDVHLIADIKGAYAPDSASR